MPASRDSKEIGGGRAKQRRPAIQRSGASRKCVPKPELRNERDSLAILLAEGIVVRNAEE
jgi:hypothetical protein